MSVRQLAVRRLRASSGLRYWRVVSRLMYSKTRGLDVRDLWLVICARQLHLDPVGDFEVDSVAAPSGVQALALQLSRHSADFVVFNRDAVVIHSWSRVLKQRQKVHPETEEAVDFTLTHNGLGEMSLIDVPRAFDVGYVECHVVYFNSPEGLGSSRAGTL